MQGIENLNYQPEITEISKMSMHHFNFSRNKLYWIWQTAGWTTFILINLLIVSSIEQLSTNRIIRSLYFLVAAIVLTHLFREFVKRRNWSEFPLKKITPRVLAASLILGILIYGTIYLGSFLTGIISHSEHTTVRMFMGVLNTTILSLLWILIYFSTHYLQNYKKTEIESLIWEAAVKDYELKTLKSQLNPHFMFNAMNSIRSLIEEDPYSAKIAVTKLSNILRYSLKMERVENVPLGEEMECVKDYLDLEKIRFEERLKYSLKIETESAKAEIPPMMIQTLVENGIKHGISKIPTGGQINIESKVDNSYLLIAIKSSGHLDDDVLKNSKGFGVANTKHRLNLLFGEKATFTLSNENENFVIAKLKIPIGEIIQ